MKRPTELIEMLSVYADVGMKAESASELHKYITHIESQLQPRKTVGDAVDWSTSFGRGNDWIYDYEDCITHDGDRFFYSCSDTTALEVICTREEFEREVWRRNTLFNVADYVEVYIERQDRWAKVKIVGFDGNTIIWRNSSDNKSYIGTPLENVRKCKPTITKAAAWDMIRDGKTVEWVSDNYNIEVK